MINIFLHVTIISSHLKFLALLCDGQLAGPCGWRPTVSANYSSPTSIVTAARVRVTRSLLCVGWGPWLLGLANP
jgi:hypothetical protein